MINNKESGEKLNGLLKLLIPSPVRRRRTILNELKFCLKKYSFVCRLIRVFQLFQHFYLKKKNLKKIWLPVKICSVWVVDIWALSVVFCIFYMIKKIKVSLSICLSTYSISSTKVYPLSGRNSTLEF